jgi:predicted small secreted protein
MKKAILLFALSFFLTACETVKGVGRDIENIGEAADRAL